MLPTNELYEQHQKIIDRAAWRVLARYNGSLLHYEGAGISKDDLVAVGAEKWTLIVRGWDGKDGPDLQRFIARCCRNAMLDYVLNQYRRARRQVTEDAAANLADDDTAVGEDSIDMADVNCLPPDVRSSVMGTLGLIEQEDGSFVGSDDPTPTFTSLPGKDPRERNKVRGMIAAITEEI
jgi:DNA-directed RNA polymerase specialized sigma24 family protein